LSSRALCPGSIYPRTSAGAHGWIPVTSTGMTTLRLWFHLRRRNS